MQDLISTTNRVHALPVDASTAPRRSIEDAAQQFEAYYIRMMLEQMRKTVGTGGLFEGREMKGYESFLYDALADRAAESRSFGLADQIIEQMRSRFPDEFPSALAPDPTAAPRTKP